MTSQLPRYGRLAGRAALITNAPGQGSDDSELRAAVRTVMSILEPRLSAALPCHQLTRSKPAVYQPPLVAGLDR
jgi:hypothetical protein